MPSRESGQPHSLYSFPKELSVLIFEKLGTAEGFIDFQHKLQFAENLMDLADILRTAEETGLLKNKFSHKPIKTKVDKQSINKMKQVWERGGYLATTYEIQGERDIPIQFEFYFDQPKDLRQNQDCIPMPSLHSMKSKDELSSEKPLLRINEPVPISIAFRDMEPTALSKNAKMQLDVGGVIYDRFTSDSDIADNIDYIKHVPRHYYDNTTTILWRVFKKYADMFRLNAFTIGKEIDEPYTDIMQTTKQRDVTELIK